MDEIIIAIDGPAASGKSTTARAVAEALGYCHLNSGLLYRAITWAALQGGWVDSVDLFGRELKHLDLELKRSPPGFAVRVDGRDPGDRLTAPATTARVSEISARPEVRQKVLGLLRDAGREKRLVCDGRDIGTEVFPDAELKVFLVATPEERGRRRLLEHGREPIGDSVAAEARQLLARDAADARRAHSPLRRAVDAVVIDTTDMTPEDVIAEIVRRARIARAHNG